MNNCNHSRILLHLLFPSIKKVIILGVKSTEDCPKFVCPSVYDDIAQDEIQLEARQVSRPPIVDLRQYGINEKDMTHWSCERPKEGELV